MVTGERQAMRIRGLYLKAILRQDVAFFDKGATSGEVVVRMSGDTIFIQEAIGENVGTFIHVVSKFFGGFIVAFTRGWLLTLVTASSIPLVILVGVSSSVMISNLSNHAQVANAEAGHVVDQTIGSIRTVVSGEEQAVEKYKTLIRTEYESAVHKGTTVGIGLACVPLIVYSTYGLAVWFSSKLIIDKGYSGGEVINVMLALMTAAVFPRV